MSRQNIEMFAVFCRAVHIVDGEAENIAVVIEGTMITNVARQDWFFVLQGCQKIAYNLCEVHGRAK